MNKNSSKNNVVSMAVFLILLAAAWPFPAAAEIVDGLRLDFYKNTCPQAEGIVREVVQSRHGMDPTITAGLLRVFFHDCFVQGCDASILLDETPSGDPVEKDSPANGFTLHGLDAIDVAKSVVESLCPRTVSCADILAFAARDAAVLAGLRHYPVAAGRRDGMSSLQSNIPGNLPDPVNDAHALTDAFLRKGMSQEDMVVLSGAHSIGVAHCFTFAHRIYNFSEDNGQDPALDHEYAARLQEACPPPRPDDDRERAPKVNLDPHTGLALDNAYYAALEAGRGLLSSDQALMEDVRTRAIVGRMARDARQWQKKFGEAMQKLGMVDVLVGDRGEIRSQCRSVNKDEPAFPVFEPLRRLIHGLLGG